MSDEFSLFSCLCFSVQSSYITLFVLVIRHPSLSSIITHAISSSFLFFPFAVANQESIKSRTFINEKHTIEERVKTKPYNKLSYSHILPISRTSFPSTHLSFPQHPTFPSTILSTFIPFPILASYSPTYPSHITVLSYTDTYLFLTVIFAIPVP